MSNTYSLRYICGNCEVEAEREFQKGQLAPTAVECENCGGECTKATRSNAGQRDFKPMPSQQIQNNNADDEEDEFDASLKAEDVIDDGISAEEKAERVKESLTEVHDSSSLKPENTDPTKRFILVGSNILNKRKEVVGYVPASEQSFEEVKAQFRGKKELEEFMRRIKIAPQTLVELYGLDPDECYFLEMLDRKWEHKRRMLPELPMLPALSDGNYEGYKKSLGIVA